MATLTIQAQVEFLESCLAFVRQCATTAGVAPQHVTKIELAAEEALMNVCQHAYDTTVGEIEVHCWRHESQQFILEVIDTGKPFDVLDHPPPDLSEAIEQRHIGGLGVLLLRAIADEVTYHRVGDRNILRLAISLPPGHIT